jgi:hypothetical protein
METNLTFLSLVGSAIGGFIGVIIFFIIRLLIEYFLKKRKLIKTYYIANGINKGNNNEQKGEIMHHHGKLIESIDELKKYNLKQAVWEWTRDQIGVGNGESIFYGPYTTDLYEPGIYEIVYYIYPIGFSKPKEVINDCNILLLDVTEITESTAVVPHKTESMIPKTKILYEKYYNINVMGNKYIKVSDLNERLVKFSIYVKSNGIGVWEFRAFAFDGNGDRNNNLEMYPATKIFFDKIEIYKIQKLNLPWD